MESAPRPVFLGPRFLAAFQFAAQKHDGQTRKAKLVPYLAHLMSVSSIVLEAGGNEDCAIAALLHDVVEDCGGRPMLREVEDWFGPMSHAWSGMYGLVQDPKPPWRQRKEEYLSRLLKEDSDTRLVSAADKIDNARSVLRDYRIHGEAVWARFNGGRDGTLWYYRALADEFNRSPADMLNSE
jgi:GTP pyrophosphokinase